MHLHISTPTIWVVTPCFHDTQSMAYLKRRADETIGQVIPNANLQFLVVDDSGGQDLAIRELQGMENLTVLTVPYNLGHQAAIVYGLRSLAERVSDHDYIVTMDSDGEDRPEDIPTLLEPLLLDSSNVFPISLAERTKRNESIVFKILYTGFKAFFRLLTGVVVRNGNFAACRGWFVRHVIFHPYFDYCYSSSLLALPVSRHKVPLARGSRYFGRSKMTLLTLVSHGFRMLLPFAERIAIRAIIASAGLFGFSFLLVSLYVFQTLTGTGYGAISIVAALAVFAFGVTVAGTSCIFFQVFNHSLASSLRSLTCTPAMVPRTQAQTQPRVAINSAAMNNRAFDLGREYQTTTAAES